MKKIWQCVEIGFALTALGIVVTFLIYAFKGRGDGVAAWVQAVGSIAAIWAAYKISEREATAQRRNAREEAANALAQRRETVVELMEDTATMCHNLGQLATDNVADYIALSDYRSSDFAYAIESLEAIDLISLQSVHLVRGIIGMVKETRAAQQLMDAGIAKRVRPPFGRIKDHCERSEAHYARAMLAIGVEPKYCPFDPDEEAYEDALYADD
ncbi:hypothetical protein [Burkholderia oklahomensis]|uniref:hypothetical protein n=1 Tax=Burkholderia oklahomensis TaxID=342113 RepID=UPI0004738A7D|nr:hypothetical protein [Burkholderia oklahomensis]AJX30693.1 hypothetical protein BG90_179 [Burkholderia oklahomensis C6786]AOI46389.1 hypothetical protein WI23_11705 [Burkholderia oklahomensis C6786]KUY56208.1 hypothetical protein WI23_20005 [Burkholderia oklahomensis C6786]MBI0361007.1 hypothetical protein [Burkholderia oklahomensis]SUW60384.1 Uncharacterised protein [Burkholderia oklahomensis]